MIVLLMFQYVSICDLHRREQGNIVLQSTRINSKVKAETSNNKDKVKVKAGKEIKNAVDPDKFRLYFDFRNSVKSIRPHQVCSKIKSGISKVTPSNVERQK